MLESHERLCRTEDGSVVAITVDVFPCCLIFKADEVVVERDELKSKVEKRNVGEYAFLVEKLQTRLGPVGNERDGIGVLQWRRRPDAPIGAKVFWTVPCDRNKGEIKRVSARWFP